MAAPAWHRHDGRRGAVPEGSGSNQPAVMRSAPGVAREADDHKTPDGIREPFRAGL